LIVIAVLAGLSPWLTQPQPGWPALTALTALKPVNAGFVAFWVVAMGATLAVAFVHRQRLLALIVIGALGLAVSMLFVYLSAPDLALTQLLVEFVTIILLMLALNWLPREGPREGSRRRKLIDAVVAGSAGLGVAFVTLMLLVRPSQTISPFFLEHSLSLGGGANVVNVILVDFRGYDTLGEITVLGIAGLVIYATLKGFSPQFEAAPWTLRTSHEEDRHPLMLALVSRLLLPVAITVSLFLLLRGHNAPGGGFIAGLVLAIALVLQFVSNGQQWLQSRLATDFHGWIGGGLLVAGLTGIGSWFFGHPFLTSTFDYLVLPLIGPVPLASAMLFDLGVYLTVCGASMVSLQAIARLRAPPAKAADEHA